VLRSDTISSHSNEDLNNQCKITRHAEVPTCLETMILIIYSTVLNIPLIGRTAIFSMYNCLPIEWPKQQVRVALV